MEPPTLLVSPTAEEEGTPLWRLCEVGDMAGVKAALGRGVEVNRRGPGGATPLLLAVGGGHNDIAWLLLLHPEIDPNLQVGGRLFMRRFVAFWCPMCLWWLKAPQDCHGFTALHLAASGDNAWAVAKLLTHPAMASANARDEEGATALMQAAMFGHVGCVRTLLEGRGVDLGVVDRQGRGLEEVAR